MSDLAARFRRLIESDGPITVARFMGESNAHYYARRDPLGNAGDFVTAPEISQMFGELIGLCLADAWHRAGRPPNAIYAELGPGRGTLAQDALRAMAGAGLRPHVHLVEASPVLRAQQAAAIRQAHFHDDAATLPQGHPLLLVANEFLDALPIRQLVRTEQGWRERMVGLNGTELAFVAGPSPLETLLPGLPQSAPPGTIVEANPGAAAVIDGVARHIARDGGVALFIDYGHLAPRTGSTLQAVRAHRKVPVLAMPGEADLTALVDFAAVAASASAAGCKVRSAAQGAWLQAMGIDVRAETLGRSAPTERRDDIIAARDRLVKPDQMGDLFKVMAIAAPGWPAVAGFAV